MISPRWNGKPLTPARIARSLQLKWRERRQPVNGLRGVYGSFAAAVAAIPPIKPIGYDAANSADWYAEKHFRVDLHDYPVLFWMNQAFADARSVFEVGGHVGVAYYGYSQVLQYPADISWTILDVPSVMAAGEVLAAKRGRHDLRFARAGLESERGADIFLAVGSLQYLETDLATVVSGFTHRPTHVLVNVTPVHDGPTFFTTQNVSSVFCAYRVFSRQEMVASMASLGYELVDSWATPRKVIVPGHPDKSTGYYCGFYFRAV